MSVVKPALQHPELITHLSGASNYTWLHFRSGEKKLLAKPISYLERELPSFIRVHKTALINPVYVDRLQEPPRRKMAGVIHLKGGSSLPVGRRRWKEVVEALTFNLTRRTEKETVREKPDQAQTPGARSFSAGTILLISDDDQNAGQARQSIERRWPDYQFRVIRQATHLPDWLSELPEDDLPAMMLIDARTTTLERLHILQRMKSNEQLCRIPIILLVSPVSQMVVDGYRRHANSVISMRDGCTYFVRAIEHVCHFWLRVAALPA